MNAQETLKEVVAAVKEGYEVKIFDNIPEAKYDFVCYKLIKGGKSEAKDYSISWSEFTELMEQQEDWVRVRFKELWDKCSEDWRELAQFLVILIMDKGKRG